MFLVFLNYQHKNSELNQVTYIATVTHEIIVSSLNLIFLRTQGKDELQIFYNLMLILFFITVWFSQKIQVKFSALFRIPVLCNSSLPVVNVGNVFCLNLNFSFINIGKCFLLYKPVGFMLTIYVGQHSTYVSGNYILYKLKLKLLKKKERQTPICEWKSRR